MSRTSLGRKSTLWLLYTAVFFFYCHEYLLVYIQSGFANQFVAEKSLLALYTAGALITFVSLLFISRILRRISNHRLILWCIVLEVLLCALLACPVPFAVVIIAFILQQAVLPIISFNLDVFIEHNSVDKKTGLIRGLTFTAGNIPLVIAPIIAGILSIDRGFSSVFYAANILAIPLWLIILFVSRTSREPRYHSTPVLATLKEFMSNHNVANVFKANLLLQIFYSWMVIYTPLYLLHRGFDWATIGIIFSIMLVPFLLLELPLGYIADSKLGEKKMMAAGFIILAATTASVSLITENNILIWAAILFATRVGASFVEIMSEVYFFKQIKGVDANEIAFFRLTRPLSYIIGPIFATISILVVGERMGFMILGAAMLLGLIYTSRLTTK